MAYEEEAAEEESTNETEDHDASEQGGQQIIGMLLMTSYTLRISVDIIIV